MCFNMYQRLRHVAYGFIALYVNTALSTYDESCHIWMSHVTYERGMSHINGSCHAWMSYFPHEWVTSHSNGPRYTYESVTSHMNMGSHIQVTSHMWMSHITNLTELYHTWNHRYAPLFESHHTATRCNTLQHTATHCNTLQHTATHCNTIGPAIGDAGAFDAKYSLSLSSKVVGVHILQVFFLFLIILFNLILLYFIWFSFWALWVIFTSYRFVYLSLSLYLSSSVCACRSCSTTSKCQRRQYCS